MSIINFSKNYLFIHIPKTGGSSIKRMLEPTLTIRDVLLGGTPFGEAIATHYLQKYGIGKHATAVQLKKELGKDQYNAMYSFSIVRNPYFRTLSIFLFLKQWKKGPYHNEIRLIKTLSQFLKSSVIEKDPIARPQATWITDDNQHLLIDEIYKLEELSHNIQKLWGVLKLEREKIPIVKINESYKL